MAELGFRTVDEMVGRTERLAATPPGGHPKARLLDFSAVIRPPLLAGSDAPRRCVRPQEHAVASHFDHELVRRAAPALERREPVRIALPVRNVHRTVGTLLAGEVLARHGAAGLPDGTIEVTLAGSVGQSAGAFLCPGVTLRVEGDANDYLGKGLSGGRIVVYPDPTCPAKPEENIVVGNTVMYGAIDGEAYFRGVAGERFCVRNSGAAAVVEGTGDHGCEYMTGGTVVVLGQTGRNFAAGMSGGIAYVLDDDGTFAARCNTAMVALEPVLAEAEQAKVEKDLVAAGKGRLRHAGKADETLLRELVERHLRFTGSTRALAVLDNWEAARAKFVKVFPAEYKRALGELYARQAAAKPAPSSKHKEAA
jgi:glutamate synthase (NADPH/NADH) large chain